MAAAFVEKFKKLSEQFSAALFLVKFDRLQNRPVVLNKAVTTRDLTPG